MAAPVKPNLVRANGKDSWWFVPAIADINAPTALEINAATGINISCHLFADQEGMTGSTGKVTLPRLLCETEQYEANDATTYSMSDLVAAFDPQGASGSNGKKAWEALKDGETGFLVRRQGVLATDGDAVTGQFVDVVPVETGPAYPGKTGTDAAGVYSFTAPVSITGKPAFNKAVV